MAEAIPYESTEKSEEAVATENKDGDIGMESSTTTDVRLVWLFDSSDALLDEAAAWIWQDFSNSVYSTVVQATFLGLLLNSYATTAAWEESGKTRPPSCSDLEVEYSEACTECRIGEGTMLCYGSGKGSENCEAFDVPSIGGVNATSFAFFIVGMSCISQLVAFVLMGQSGDYSNNRKSYLFICSSIGALSLIAFAIFPIGEAYWKHVVAALLTIISNTAFGLAQIFYNAYLPLITEDMEKRYDGKVSADTIQNTISSYGLASGYYSGVLGLFISIGILASAGGLSESSSEYVIVSSFRWCIVFAGIWWLIGNFLTIPRLQSRPGKEGNPVWYHSAQQFYNTISWTYTNLPVTFRYLCLYFCYSDGFSTISGLGLLYARLEMCAGTLDLFVIAIEAPLCAGIGNTLFLFISRHFKLTNRQMVVLVLMIIAVLPFWGILGYATDAIGFRNKWEAYVLGAYFGFCLGAIQNFTRTMFCELIPRSREAEYFSFYELTDKGSSWLGPVVVGALAAGDGGSLRLAFVYIFCMTVIPAVLISQLDMEKGVRDAQQVARDDEKSQYVGSEEGACDTEMTVTKGDDAVEKGL